MKRPYQLLLKKGDKTWRYSRFAYAERATTEGRRLVRMWGDGYSFVVKRVGGSEETE